MFQSLLFSILCELWFGSVVSVSKHWSNHFGVKARAVNLSQIQLEDIPFPVPIMKQQLRPGASVDWKSLILRWHPGEFCA